MLRTTAHQQQLRRMDPAKGYVAGICNASTVAVTSDLGARPDKARLRAAFLGNGQTIFAPSEFTKLRLLGSKSYECGIEVNRYAPAA
jgi:hypothetical protein